MFWAKNRPFRAKPCPPVSIVFGKLKLTSTIAILGGKTSNLGLMRLRTWMSILQATSDMIKRATPYSQIASKLAHLRKSHSKCTITQ